MQYDTDDTGNISHLELTSMLDSLGSTLTRTTVNSFFTRYNKKPQHDELTVAEAIQCLETELLRPDSEKKRVDADDGLPDSSVSATPILTASDREGGALPLDQLDFSGPPLSGRAADVGDGRPPAPGRFTIEPAEQLLVDATMGGTGSGADLMGVASTPGPYPEPIGRQASSSSSDAEDSSGSGSAWGSNSNTDPLTSSKSKSKSKPKAKSQSTSTSEDSFERVINVKNCPLCHRPRLNSKAEMDIVTHLAVCASQDWNKVDRIVVGNFVTASQAQRKWYTKVISKVSSGDYKLGAVSRFLRLGLGCCCYGLDADGWWL